VAKTGGGDQLMLTRARWEARSRQHGGSGCRDNGEHGGSRGGDDDDGGSSTSSGDGAANLGPRVERPRLSNCGGLTCVCNLM
jgi:hypothetical protein